MFNLLNTVIYGGAPSGGTEYIVDMYGGYTSILILTVMCIGALILGRLLERFFPNIPKILGYLVAGFLVSLAGPSVFQQLNKITDFYDPAYGGETGLAAAKASYIHILHMLHMITNIGFGVLSFHIGTELFRGKLKKAGAKKIIITLVQTIVTFAITFVVLYYVALRFIPNGQEEYLHIALLLAAIATATTPLLIHEFHHKYRTKGEFTDTINAVVSLDDAFGVIAFGIVLEIVMMMFSSGSNTITNQIIADAALEFGLSIGVGLVIGIISSFIVKAIHKSEDHKDEYYMDFILVIVVISVSMATIIDGISPVLVPFFIGATLTNFIDSELHHEIVESLERFEAPLMVAFFAIAGAELNIDELFAACQLLWPVILLYSVGRALGKMLGATIGAFVTNSDYTVKKYLGIGLLPQSGMALELATMAQGLLVAALAANGLPGDKAYEFYAIVLVSIILFALFSNKFVEYSYLHSGDIPQKHCPDKFITVNKEITKKYKERDVRLAEKKAQKDAIKAKNAKDQKLANEIETKAKGETKKTTKTTDKPKAKGKGKS